MKRERWRGPEGPELLTVSIYCTGYEHDIEYQCTQQEADRIVNSFLHDKFIKIVDWDETDYINVHNIIRINVE